MRQFDVIHNPSREMHAFAPFLVNVQSHHLSGVDTLVVAPLVQDAARPLTALDIPVDFDERILVLALAELSSLLPPTSARRIGSLAHREDDIRRALDKLFSGF